MIRKTFVIYLILVWSLSTQAKTIRSFDDGNFFVDSISVADNQDRRMIRFCHTKEEKKKGECSTYPNSRYYSHFEFQGDSADWSAFFDRCMSFQGTNALYRFTMLAAITVLTLGIGPAVGGITLGSARGAGYLTGQVKSRSLLSRGYWWDMGKKSLVTTAISTPPSILSQMMNGPYPEIPDEVVFQVARFFKYALSPADELTIQPKENLEAFEQILGLCTAKMDVWLTERARERQRLVMRSSYFGTAKQKASCQGCHGAGEYQNANAKLPQTVGFVPQFISDQSVSADELRAFLNENSK